MRNGKGASAPLFFESCIPSLRADALLNTALQALECGDFASALIAAEYACRRFPNRSIAAILRAQILKRCKPELASKAWYFAWCIDPQDVFLQDVMLDAWATSGALQNVRELAPLFLPVRCQSEQYLSLIDQLNKAQLNRFGACWRVGDLIAGKIFAPILASGQHETVHLLVSNENQQFVYALQANGKTFEINCPLPNEVWSLAFIDVEHLKTPELLHGSPLSFSTVDQQTLTPELVDAAKSSRDTQSFDVREVCVLIPVYRGFSQVRACLESVLGSVADNQTHVTVLVINDASPEPALSKWLDDLATAGQITLLRNTYNLGFIETVNRGLRYAKKLEADVLLLNADTLVHGNWIDRMTQALYSAADIASVTPWSNNGEISSFPKIADNNPVPSFEQLKSIDACAAELQASGKISDIEVPACCGFAMLMRLDVIRQIGLLDGYYLTRGYSEEVDWCLRASSQGYRHLVATGVFVAHAGGVSFGAEKTYRVSQNRSIIAARYPQYYETYRRFVKEDPMQGQRKLLHQALRNTSCTWLSKLNAGFSESQALSPRVLPSALPTRYERIAVWENRMSSVFSHKILSLARHLATLAATCEAGNPLVNLRLLIIGEVSEGLWHTGVVDVLPSIASQKSSLLNDTVMLGFAGCKEVLTESSQQVALNIKQVQIDEDFDPVIYLDNWIKSNG